MNSSWRNNHHVTRNNICNKENNDNNNSINSNVISRSTKRKRKLQSSCNSLHGCSSPSSKHLVTVARMNERRSSVPDTCHNVVLMPLGAPLLGYELMSYEIWLLFNSVKQTEECLGRKRFVRESIYKTIISKLSVPLDLYIVGSSCNGLATNSSDIDLCLVLGKSPEENNKKTQAIPLLEYVKQIISDLSYVKDPELILAKVPLLKFTDCDGSLEVDLNVNNIVGIRNTQLIGCYARCDWRVAPLVIAAKTWAKRNGINDAHNKTFSSYSIVLMVIHFLQCREPAVLPCLHKLMPENFKPDSDVKTLTLFTDLPEFKSKNRETIGSLFQGFLNYYSYTFQYKTDAISIRSGSTIPKFSAQEHISPKNTVGQWRYICVEEPFDRTNTARSVYDEESFNHILQVFRQSYFTIKQTQSFLSVLNMSNSMSTII